ncbi:MAG: polysaccharide deacetylase family protein [Acidimicrobiia bacterium]
MATFTKVALKWSARTADRLRPPAPGVVVLIYHRVGARTPLDVDMPLALFDEQMDALARSGRVRSLDDALDALAAPVRARGDVDPIVITFDDGTADFAELAVPVLASHALPATLYVATDFVDRGVDFPAHGRPLSWSGLRDVAATGLVTVGSHTHTHALLDRLPAEAIATELDRADDLIESQLGIRPRHFAYPKAVAGSAAADAAVRARYRSAALAGTRPNAYGSTDPFRLARSPIQTSDGMRYFHAKVAGGMGLEDRLRDAVNRWRYRGATG